MIEMCLSLGIESHIQREAVHLLLASRRGFMRSDLFRERLILSLASGGNSAIFLPRINSEVESLIEQQLLIRQVKGSKHEIGLNKIVWKVSPETVNSIREATTRVRSSCLFAAQLGDVVENVKIQLRKMKVSRSQVSDAVFEILVSRFSSSHL